MNQASVQSGNCKTNQCCIRFLKYLDRYPGIFAAKCQTLSCSNNGKKIFTCFLCDPSFIKFSTAKTYPINHSHGKRHKNKLKHFLSTFCPKVPICQSKEQQQTDISYLPKSNADPNPSMNGTSTQPVVDDALVSTLDQDIAMNVIDDVTNNPSLLSAGVYARVF